MPAQPTFDRSQLEAFWMPFTANRQFKANPRLLARAEGMHYWTPEGRQILDGVAGLWCVNAGHGRQRDRRGRRAARSRRWTSRRPSRWATRSPSSWPTSSCAGARRPRPRVLHQLGLRVGGHRAQDRARLPPRARRGHAHAPDRPRARLPRRGLRRHLRGRHGQQPQVLRRACCRAWTTCPTRTTSRTTPSRRGEPAWGAHLADELERLVALHDASNIAAVIVEPVAGSTGVLMPPKGYLQRLREICTKHGILLIFDEVITGFGRTGLAVRRAALRRRCRT